MVKLFVVRFSMWDLQCVEKDLVELNSWGVLHWWQTCKCDSLKYSNGMLASSCLCSSVRCLNKVDLQSKPLGLSALGCCVQSGKGHAKVVVRGSVLTCLVWESRSWHHLRLEEVVVKWVNLCPMWLDGDMKLVDMMKEIGAGRRVLMNWHVAVWMTWLLMDDVDDFGDEINSSIQKFDRVRTEWGRARLMLLGIMVGMKVSNRDWWENAVGWLDREVETREVRWEVRLSRDYSWWMMRGSQITRWLV